MPIRLKSPFTIYQFYLRLRGVEPANWRRLHVMDCTFDYLTQSFFVAMGLQTRISISHVAMVRGDMQHRRLPGEAKILPTDTPISQLLPVEGGWFWHEVSAGPWNLDSYFEGCLPGILGTTYPRCIVGARAGIPRDGLEPEGLRLFLGALADVEHPHHEAAVRRSELHDPAAFDLEVVNADLMRLCGSQSEYHEEDDVSEPGGPINAFPHSRADFRAGGMGDGFNALDDPQGSW
jgi:hypothetical protein